MPNEKWLDTANNTQIIIHILAKPFLFFHEEFLTTHI